MAADNLLKQIRRDVWFTVAPEECPSHKGAGLYRGGPVRTGIGDVSKDSPPLCLSSSRAADGATFVSDCAENGACAWPSEVASH